MESELHQNLPLREQLRSSRSKMEHLGGNPSIPKKKKKAKFELASLVAKDLEELSRRRGIKEEPVEEASGLLEMPSSNGIPSFITPSYGEDSMGSSSLRLGADATASGVEPRSGFLPEPTDDNLVLEATHTDTTAVCPVQL